MLNGEGTFSRRWRAISGSTLARSLNSPAPPRIAPSIFAVLQLRISLYCTAQRHLINRNFDWQFGRSFLWNPLWFSGSAPFQGGGGAISGVTGERPAPSRSTTDHPIRFRATTFTNCPVQYKDILLTCISTENSVDLLEENLLGIPLWFSVRGPFREGGGRSQGARGKGLFRPRPTVRPAMQRRASSGLTPRSEQSVVVRFMRRGSSQ